MQATSENPIYKAIAAKLATTYTHTTTGRPRRIGWMDIVALKYVARSDCGMQ